MEHMFDCYVSAEEAMAMGPEAMAFLSLSPEGGYVGRGNLGEEDRALAREIAMTAIAAKHAHGLSDEETADVLAGTLIFRGISVPGMWQGGGWFDDLANGVVNFMSGLVGAPRD